MLDLNAWAGRRVLITGGSGFIGAHVIAQGAQAGIELINFSASGKQTQPAHTITIDLRQRDDVMAHIRTLQPDAILHLAAGGVQYGSGSMDDLIRINVLGLQALLEAAAILTTPPPVVIAGSWFEYSPAGRALRETDPTEPTAPYSATKVAANAIARHYADRLPLTVLRLFAIYGVGEQLPRLFPSIIDAAMRAIPLDLTKCEQVRDYVNVSDAAEAFWRALTLPPELFTPMRILNIGTGEPTSLKTLVLLLSEILRTHGYNPDLRFGIKPYRLDENMYGVADVSMLKSAFGWLPSTNFDDGLLNMLNRFVTDSAKAE